VTDAKTAWLILITLCFVPGSSLAGGPHEWRDAPSPMLAPGSESWVQRELGSMLDESRMFANPTGGKADAGAGGGGVGLSADEAARKSSNPLGGDFMIFLNQIDNYFMQGDVTQSSRTDTVNTWSIQPVLPFKMPFIGEDWIFVTRPTFPFVMHADQPDLSSLGPGAKPPIVNPPPGFMPPLGGAPFRSDGGFGDIVWFNLLGVSKPQEAAGGGDLVLAGGLTTQWPSASKRVLGSGKYSLGPSAVGAFIGKKFILGGLLQQWFSVASAESGRDDVTFTWLNLFYFLNFPGGWQVGGTPIITADWEANSSNRWTVPIGVGVYKTSLIGGKMPLKLGVEFQYMPVRPDLYGQEFNIRFTIAPILPHPTKWLPN
jgi:hypothetical protein